MFWITVGHASRQTAAAIGPSTIDRSNLDAEEVEGGWIQRFYPTAGRGPAGCERCDERRRRGGRAARRAEPVEQISRAGSALRLDRMAISSI
jgi:hypothetical protein